MAEDFEGLRGLIERFSKRCPKCGESRLTSDNSTPLNHRCLSCGWKGTDLEVLLPPKGGWTEQHRRTRTLHACRQAAEFARTFGHAADKEKLEAELALIHADCPGRITVHVVGVVITCDCPCHAQAKTKAASAEE